MTTRLSDQQSTTSDEFEAVQLARFLYRPIVFREPERIVHPGSWLEHIPFAFWIVESLRPSVFVELGTQSGNSYAGFAQAVQTLALPTKCYAVDTWQGDAQAGYYDESVFVEWTSYHDHRFSAFSRLIRSTFDEAAGHFTDGSVNLLHLDGCHTYDAVSADLALWRPKLSRRGIILMHDVNVRERDFGAWRLWEELKAQSPHFQFLHGHGLGVLAAGPDLAEPLQWLLSRSPRHESDIVTIRQFFARLGSVVAARLSPGAAPREVVADSAADVAARIAQLEGVVETERNEHEQRSRRQWEIAAQLQDLVRQEMEQRRHVEAALDVQNTALSRVADDLAHERVRLASLQDQRAIELTQATDQMTLLRGQVATLSEDVEAQAAQVVELDGQRMELAATLESKTRLLSDLRERLEAERLRRWQVEDERNRLAAASEARGFRELTRKITWLALGSRVRSLQRIARTPAALGLLPVAGRRAYKSSVGFLARPRQMREAHIIVASGLFDEDYYRASHPDVAASRLTPLAHYVLEGGREGRKPHPLFDGAYYLRSNPDVAAARVNPLVHYRRVGAFEGRNPHPLFDVAYYLTNNPDVKEARVEPLLHFLRFGAEDGRNPNPFFDCAYYLQRQPDVAASQMNPLLHFVSYGWREGRQTSMLFDTAYYVGRYDDIPVDANPLAHYLEHGRLEGRTTVADANAPPPLPIEGECAIERPRIVLSSRSLIAKRAEQPTLVCLSHVMPIPPRAGNEYRIYRMLRWFRDRGYRVIPVIAPLPGDDVTTDAIKTLGDEFRNAVLCDRDGRLEYVLRDVPDVLASLGGESARPVSILLDEDVEQDSQLRQLLDMDRTFCHDALITTTLRLHQALGSYVLLAEYIWMSRVLPLLSGNVVKVVDTIDVFSSKRDKVQRFGIDDLHVPGAEEAKRLSHADLIVAIQSDERQELQQLLPGKRVVTAGVDFEVVREAGVPSGRGILYVASDNPMNRKGLADFIRFAWHRIRERVPDAELLLAGRVCNSLDAAIPGVVQLGVVGDLDSLYRQARVVINPAVAGTGLKIKTVEALGHLRPIVTWPNGTDGLAPELKAFCVVVHDWFEFANRLCELLARETPLLFSANDRDAIVRLTSPDTTYQEVTSAISELCEQRFEATVAGSRNRD